MHPNRASYLHLISGDLSKVVNVGNVAIQFGPKQRPPFPVHAIVVEQDTSMVLDEEPIIYAPTDSLQRLCAEVERFREPPLGSVITRRGKPRRFYTIIHDLEQTPTWREEWIVDGLKNLFIEAERLELENIAMPLLGTRFGNLTPNRFMELLCNTLLSMPPSSPFKLWLVAPRHRTHSLLMALRRYSEG